MFQLRTKSRFDQQSVGGSQPTAPGYYFAKILSVEPTNSRSGKAMLKLSIEVDTGAPRCLEVVDYLILHSDHSWKIEQYLAAVGVQFEAGQDITIEPRTFLGGKFVAVTCNEPGMKNPDRLYLRVLHAVRPQSAPHMGALLPDELEYYGLNPDGTQKGAERRAVAQQQPVQNASWQNPPSMGRQQPAGSWQQPHPGHQPPQQCGSGNWQQGSGQPSPMLENEDDIPF